MGSQELVVFNGNGSERFRRKPGRSLTFGGEAYEEFDANGIHSFVDDRGRRRLFLMSINRPWFPSVLEELDPQGRLLSEYVASGHQMSVIRLRFRGRDTLALTGYHNETRGGSITILDLDNPSGRAPGKDPRFACANCRVGDPLAILVTPRSDVLREVAGPQGTVGIQALNIVDDRMIDFLTDHGRFKDVDGMLQDAAISYSIARDFSRVLDVRPSESVKVFHNLFFKEGRLNHRYGAGDEAAIGRVVIWDGRDWTPLPHN